MIKYNIPGKEEIEIENIILDYNGTIAVDGILIDGVRDKIDILKDFLNIYIVTADTYGSVKKQCSNLPVEILTFPKENAGLEKEKIIENLNPHKTIAVGNGFNDIKMFKKSILSIAIIEAEGCSSELILNSDIICKSIIDAFNIILDKNKVIANLRN